MWINHLAVINIACAMRTMQYLPADVVRMAHATAKSDDLGRQKKLNVWLRTSKLLRM